MMSPADFDPVEGYEALRQRVIEALERGNKAFLEKHATKISRRKGHRAVLRYREPAPSPKRKGPKATLATR
jgi:hypothetical protein